MKNIIITIFGIVVNILIYMYSQSTKMDLNMIVPKIYLFFILPLICMVIVIVSIVYNFYKQKNKSRILSKMLIGFFLLLLVIQFLLFSNDVLVK